MQWIKTYEKKFGQAIVREELILDNDGEVWDRVEAVSEIRGYQSGMAWAYFWGDFQ